MVELIISGNHFPMLKVLGVYPTSDVCACIGSANGGVAALSNRVALIARRRNI